MPENKLEEGSKISQSSNHSQGSKERPKTVISKALSEAKIIIPDVISSNKSLLGQKLMVNSFEN